MTRPRPRGGDARGRRHLLRLLAPIAPHVTHHLWRELGFGDGHPATPPGPRWTRRRCKQDSIDYVVQVNGKVRGKVTVPADADRAAVEAAALAHEAVRRFTDGAPRCARSSWCPASW